MVPRLVNLRASTNHNSYVALLTWPRLGYNPLVLRLAWRLLGNTPALVELVRPFQENIAAG